MLEARREPLTFPRCGNAMNLHAEKPDPAEGDAEGEAAIEVHACPVCHSVAVRPAIS